MSDTIDSKKRNDIKVGGIGNDRPLKRSGLSKAGAQIRLEFPEV